MRHLNVRILMEKATILVLFLFSLHIQKIYTAEIDLISDSKFLTEADTLVSPGGNFELGFFRSGSAENKYVGIWYKKISVQTVVWVANRDFPVNGSSSGTLRIISPGNLVLMNGNDTNDVLWSSNTTSSGNVTVQLDDTGNLAVREGIGEKILWQSFDYPTDTLLPGMKLGRSFLTGKEWFLSSWKSNQDPAPGEFTWSAGTSGYPQIILKQGTSIKFRGGPWNGVWFSGDSASTKNIITGDMIINETEAYYSYSLLNTSVISRLVLNSSGQLERWVWVIDVNKWQIFLQLERDFCDGYNICYGYGTCSTLTSQRCSCLDEIRFVPRNQKGWEIANWSGGCVRRTPLDCKNGTDGFIKYSNVKLPDTETSWFNISMTLNECREKCFKNCTCMAYSNIDIRRGGNGCLLWFGELLDMKEIPDRNGGQDIFVRMASSELVHEKMERANLKIILPVVFLGVLLIGLSSTWFHYACRKRHHQQLRKDSGEFLDVGQSQRDAMELPLFSFSTLARATASFSPYNKIGEGGFGSVYKGVLEEGLEIAVKRLSTTSSQGLDEFKNEVICISKLQHRNLVKLLGCSIQGDEKLLIYEYMPNRSLDLCLFDKTRSSQLDWTTRFNITKGIARGLLYLHQDSRLRIIHRDLKASNVLLDRDMNPKISDFGMARSFGGNESQANTQRVVGTYGYMSPEYALDGVFSFKSDVFSFGVLVLEIVSGKRNRGFIHSEHDNNLLGHAWRMHNEGRSMELIDTSLSQSSNSSEVIRSIMVGLLCVQQSPNDRPNMSSVVLMLGNEGILQKPKQPGFFIERILHGADISSSSYPTSSTNDLTVTEVVAR
ncbi:unnamed protein product [Lactuca virosa]|uniref:Receptor-like serine/threonine-protein kinase n=1 Tax=Lactuca virosa TaxID=75947 RepID=A0AAU9PIL4_9ASTR|nr:unnamed protein product [Lactuca virosa]